LLGRAVQQRFPVYYQYFATPSFRYKGTEMRNHNHLLGQVEGLDGIKTGYTEASGYNLTSSVRRDHRHIVAVVLGGTSNGTRDARMRQLIEECIVKASTEQTAPMIVEVNAPLQQESPRAFTVAPAAKPTVAMGGTDGVAANTNAEPVPVPRPRALVAKPPAHPLRLDWREGATARPTIIPDKPSLSAQHVHNTQSSP
jgi:D-alanyl-D-alanine carboxypeptidase